MSSFGGINTDVKERFGSLEEIDGVLCALGGAGKDIGIIHKLGRSLGEEGAAGVSREIRVDGEKGGLKGGEDDIFYHKVGEGGTTAALGCTHGCVEGKFRVFSWRA